MRLSHIQRHVHHAVNILLNRDYTLLHQGASEWAIAHRLAVYLEQLIIGWNIDCEYNRQGLGSDPKRDRYDQRIRPDIIVHHRGLSSAEHNLLVVEIKIRAADDDLVKTCEYTSPPSDFSSFQYKYGLALSFLSDMTFSWYSKGEMVESYIWR